ncbi:hypothetical protein MK163_17200, partial [bacterium]|nr:hypothetical protein [bacterium]
ERAYGMARRMVFPSTSVAMDDKKRDLQIAMDDMLVLLVAAVVVVGGVVWAFAGLILAILLLGVPVVRFGVWHGAGRVFDRAAVRRTGIEPRHLLELDDLALVIALGLAAVLPADQGAALLAAVLVGQRLMHLAALWAASRLGSLAGARGGG